jgi:hypothetical protein
MDSEEASESGTDSGRTDSNSLPSCKLAPDVEGAAGEFDDKVPAAKFHAPSKTVLHENGTVGVESAEDGGETSGFVIASGIADGSAVKIDSLGSVKSDTGTGLDN